MKQMLCLLLLLSSAWVFAEEECDETPSKIKPLLEVANAAAKSGCPNATGLTSLCMAITSGAKDSSGKYDFAYQKIIMEASCVTSSDSEASIGRKVNTMWKTFEERLVCETASFDVIKGNILKYAVSKRFEDFLFDAAMMWKVNLNRIDPSDGRTVLDYVKKELDKYKGTPSEKTLKSYYDMLKSSGAKHKSEL